MTTAFKALIQSIYGVFASITFTVITVMTLVLLVFIPGQQRRRHLVHRAARLVFFVNGVPLKIDGLAHLPENNCVVVSNHASYLDGIILVAALPPRFAFVIKREMTRVPFAHFLLRRIGSEFVERFDNHRSAMDARRILQTAGTGQSLVFFPEGTFTAEPGLRRFHSGAFVAARRRQLPLIPIIIQGSRHMLPANKTLPRPGRINVLIKGPVATTDPDTQVADLQFICRETILRDLDEPDALNTKDTD